MSDSIRFLQKVAFPDADNTKATGCHVGVLGAVKAHSSLLASVGGWKQRRMAMPVVAIKLHDKLGGRDKCVNAKLGPDDMLGDIVNSDRVKDSIADSLWLCLSAKRLLGGHRQQHFAPLRVRVATRQRAIGHVVGARLGPRWRPSKGYPANETGMRCLVPALPKVMALGVTEALTGQRPLISGLVHQGAALNTGDGLAGSSCWSFRRFKADARAIATTEPHRTIKGLGAADAWLGLENSGVTSHKHAIARRP